MVSPILTWIQIFFNRYSKIFSPWPSCGLMYNSSPSGFEFQMIMLPAAIRFNVTRILCKPQLYACSFSQIFQREIHGEPLDGLLKKNCCTLWILYIGGASMLTSADQALGSYINTDTHQDQLIKSAVADQCFWQDPEQI